MQPRVQTQKTIDYISIMSENKSDVCRYDVILGYVWYV